MATVTPQMIKDLREMTGAGFTDCKKALDQASGDIEKAVIVLRERGLAAAAKKSGRAASEGVVVVSVNDETNQGFIIEVNSETDFVAKNEEFQNFVKEVQSLVVAHKPATVENLRLLKLNGGLTIADRTAELVAKIGENILVRRYVTIGTSDSYVMSYVHGVRIGVLVEMRAANITSEHKNNPLLQEAVKDVALQIAAMKPVYVSKDSVPAEKLAEEKEIYYNQYRNQGKPEAALPKIVNSRVETWYKESCLTEQEFFKDSTKSISGMLAEVAKKIGLNGLVINSFERLELGVGVDKKVVDFATEVAAQIAESAK